MNFAAWKTITGDPDTRSSIRNRMVEILSNLGVLFYILVVIPCIAAFLYFFVFASDVYVSQSSFVVRNSDAPKISGLGSLLSSGLGGSPASDDNTYAAENFMTSRDALQFLNQNHYIEKVYQRNNVSVFDRFNPFGSRNSAERLYDYFQNMIKVDHDRSTSITTIKVKAYTAADARQINEQMLRQAEFVINRLNVRARADVLGYAERELARAQGDFRQSSIALASYRNKVGIIDPEREATANIELTSKLKDDLIRSQTQYAELQAIAPQNPQMAEISSHIASLKKALLDQKQTLTGNDQSMASRGIAFQKLQLNNQLAEKELAIALTALQDAHAEAAKKQSYLETITQPSRPDRPQEPRRLRGLLSTLLFSLIVWGLVRVLVAGVQEHQD